MTPDAARWAEIKSLFEAVVDAPPAQREALIGAAALESKALEKPVERRHVSLDAMAADVRNHLGGWPVSARPASWRHHMAKRIARNRLPSGVVAAGVLTLLGGVVGIAWQAHVAQQARWLAESRLAEVRRVTHALVFGFGDAVEYLPGGMKIKADPYQETLAALAAPGSLPGQRRHRAGRHRTDACPPGGGPCAGRPGVAGRRGALPAPRAACGTAVRAAAAPCAAER